MHLSLAVLAILAAELGPAAAAPVQSNAHTLQKRSFNVQRVAVGPAAKKNVVASMKAALGKYKLPVPEGLANADLSVWEACNMPGMHGNPMPSGGSDAEAPLPTSTNAPVAATDAPAAPKPAAGQTGLVSNTPEGDDVAYLAPITVGGQQLMMDFDTGSSDLWVFNTGLPAQAQQGHTNFDPQKSSTFKQLPGQSFEVSYGDGSEVQGSTVGTDTVTIGGATVPNQVVELPDQVATSFVQQTQSNGLVGLAQTAGNEVKPDQAKTFLDNIHSTLAEPIMAANLKHATPGSYDFGAVDTAAFKGPLQYASVTAGSKYWQFTSNQFAVGTGAPQTNPNASPAIADTGTTLMVVDELVAQQYWAQVQGAQQDTQTQTWTFPCSATLPDLHVQLAPGALSTIPGALFNFQPVNQGQGGMRRRGASNEAREEFIIEFEPLGEGEGEGEGDVEAPQTQMCAGGLQGNGNTGIQIYGDVMFKAQYVVFNQGNQTLGFAPHA